MKHARFKSIILALVAYLCVDMAGAYDRSVLPVPMHVTSSAKSGIEVVAELDTFPLGLLADLEFSFSGEIAFGDTDHDGANELAFTGGSNSYRIWEHQGGNIYSLEASGGSNLHVYAIGDLDQDGRSEIIGQTSGYVQVVESVDSTSHPSELVWSSPYLSNTTGFPTIGDSDGDGQMEILQSINGIGSASGLAIFENTGSDVFTWVFNDVLPGPSATGPKLITDLDGDGLKEIALCGDPGWLHIYESPDNNIWVPRLREWTGLYNAYTMVGGRDTDSNGKPEIFIMGTLFTDSTANYCAIIYEASGDNSYARVATLVMDEGVGAGSAAVCNVDGVGPEEYLVRSSGPGIRVFRADTPGHWHLIGLVYGPGGGVSAYDLNRNGIPEVIRQHWTTRIFEHPTIPAWSDPRFDETLLEEYTGLTRRVIWNREQLGEQTGGGFSHLNSSASRLVESSAARFRSLS
jgi:hypothetical protein